MALQPVPPLNTADHRGPQLVSFLTAFCSWMDIAQLYDYFHAHDKAQVMQEFIQRQRECQQTLCPPFTSRLSGSNLGDCDSETFVRLSTLVD